MTELEETRTLLENSERGKKIAETELQVGKMRELFALAFVKNIYKYKGVPSVLFFLQSFYTVSSYPPFHNKKIYSKKNTIIQCYQNCKFFFFKKLHFLFLT